MQTENLFADLHPMVIFSETPEGIEHVVIYEGLLPIVEAVVEDDTIVSVRMTKNFCLSLWDEAWIEAAQGQFDVLPEAFFARLVDAGFNEKVFRSLFSDGWTRFTALEVPVDLSLYMDDLHEALIAMNDQGVLATENFELAQTTLLGDIALELPEGSLSKEEIQDFAQIVKTTLMEPFVEAGGDVTHLTVGENTIELLPADATDTPNGPAVLFVMSDAKGEAGLPLGCFWVYQEHNLAMGSREHAELLSAFEPSIAEEMWAQDQVFSINNMVETIDPEYFTEDSRARRRAALVPFYGLAMQESLNFEAFFTKFLERFPTWCNDWAGDQRTLFAMQKDLFELLAELDEAELEHDHDHDHECGCGCGCSGH